MQFDTIEELDELYWGTVLPTYTLKQVPHQSSRSLFFHLQEKFEAGEINSTADMFEEINYCIDTGLVSGMFFDPSIKE